MEYCSKVLQDEFLKRQRVNCSYSMRAFARDMELAVPVVSQVFQGKIRIPKKMAEILADRLSLTPIKRKRFVQSVLNPTKHLMKKENTPQFNDDSRVLEEERDYKIIAEWEHYAVFSLMDVEDFKPDIEWIAKRLSLSKIRVKDVVQRLIEGKIISVDDEGKMVKKVKVLTTTMDVPSSAIRSAHREELKMAETALDGLGVDDRYFSSATLAIDKEDLGEVKLIFREFGQRILQYVNNSKKNEVYQFCFQAFPLTDVRQKRK